MKDSSRFLVLPESLKDDPRVIQAGREAAWLHVATLMYLQQYEHLDPFDTVITPEVLRRIAWGDDAEPIALRLVEVGLWRRGQNARYHWYIIPGYRDLVKARASLTRRDGRRRAARDE